MGRSGHSENGQTIIAVSVSLLYEQNRRCRSVTSEAGGWRPACPLPAESLGQTLRQLVHRGQPVPTPRPRSAGRGQREACSCRVCVATPVTSPTRADAGFLQLGFYDPAVLQQAGWAAVSGLHAAADCSNTQLSQLQHSRHRGQYSLYCLDIYRKVCLSFLTSYCTGVPVNIKFSMFKSVQL